MLIIVTGSPACHGPTPPSVCSRRVRPSESRWIAASLRCVMRLPSASVCVDSVIDRALYGLPLTTGPEHIAFAGE